MSVPGVHVVAAAAGLLGAHVLRRPYELSSLRVNRFLGELLVRCLGDPEVNDLRNGFPWTSVTRTLDAFRSRWMTAFWCACCTASQTLRNSSSAPSWSRTADRSNS